MNIQEGDTIYCLKQGNYCKGKIVSIKHTTGKTIIGMLEYNLGNKVKKRGFIVFPGKEPSKYFFSLQDLYIHILEKNIDVLPDIRKQAERFREKHPEYFI